MTEPHGSLQNPGSYRNEESQQGFDEGSTSIGALMQSSAIVLENECLILEKQLEEKTNWLQDLKKNNERQAKNISKQQLELEQLKVKTHKQQINRESCLAKISQLRNKAETLQNYCSDWSVGINMMLSCKEQLTQIQQQISDKQQKEAQYYNQLEQQYKNAIANAKHARDKLKAQQEREKSEFDAIKAHLRSQIKLQEQRKKDLKKQQREVKGDCREMVTKINVLTPRNEELMKTLEQLKNEVAAEKEKVQSTSDQLQTSIKEEKIKKEELTKKIEDTEKNIYDTKNKLLEQEIEIKVLDSKQKELNAEEEELTKVLEAQLAENNRLHATAESMKERFSVLMETKEENSTLKLKCEELEGVSEVYKKKINDVQEVERSFHQELEKINNTIEEKEKERSLIIGERLAIKEKIQIIQKEMDDDVDEHKHLSIEIDKRYADLKIENDSLTESLNSLNEELSETSKDKEAFETVLRNLKVQLKRAQAISQEDDYKLLSFAEECKMVKRDMKTDKDMLVEMKASTINNYKQALKDLQMNEDTKQEIEHLKIELERKRVMYAESLEQQQEFQNKQVEAKNREMADLKVWYERAFQDKEQSKTDALMELRENKARIVDLTQQKGLAESEIRTTKNNLVKCDNLLLKLEKKLNVVAQVATNSQSIVGPSSQSTNLRTQASVVASPPSDSSGLTFNPDEVMHQKPYTGSFKKDMVKKTNIPKQATKKKTTKRKNDVNTEDFDDWGF